MYGRNDLWTLSFLKLNCLNGSAIRTGVLLNGIGTAYFRESEIFGVRCHNSGGASYPTVDLMGRSSVNGGAGCNELRLFDLNIFAAYNCMSFFLFFHILVIIFHYM